MSTGKATLVGDFYPKARAGLSLQKMRRSHQPVAKELLHTRHNTNTVGNGEEKHENISHTHTDTHTMGTHI